MSYDVIGDIHGHADQLKALLIKLSYSERNGAWRHPTRSAVFVGDLIDRGPGQLPTLELVRSMVDAGTARATMGNHEFNAIAWATPDPLNEQYHLRPRHGDKGEKNRHQHQAFLKEIGEDSPEHRYWINWFYGLPLWIREPGFQVVHACWSPKHLDVLRPHLQNGDCLTPKVIEAASKRGNPIYDAVETLLKGVEVRLPSGYNFTDKDGHIRQEIRTRWWKPELATYRDAYIGPSGVDIPNIPMDAQKNVPEPDRPTFIGHYWFDPKGALEPVSRRVACVDYSVARGGKLVAYRFDGEPELSRDKFVAV